MSSQPDQTGAEQVPGEALPEKTERLLHEQLDLALRRGGQVPADVSESIYNLACALSELTRGDE